MVTLSQRSVEDINSAEQRGFYVFSGALNKKWKYSNSRHEYLNKLWRSTSLLMFILINIHQMIDTIDSVWLIQRVMWVNEWFSFLRLNYMQKRSWQKKKRVMKIRFLTVRFCPEVNNVILVADT